MIEAQTALELYDYEKEARAFEERYPYELHVAPDAKAAAKANGVLPRFAAVFLAKAARDYGIEVEIDDQTIHPVLLGDLESQCGAGVARLLNYNAGEKIGRLERVSDGFKKTIRDYMYLKPENRGHLQVA